MQDCIAYFEKDFRDKENLSARIHAVGWSGLFNGFSGKDDKKMSAMDLLPFRVEEENKELNTLPDSTKRCIKRLMVTNRLPYGVFKALAFSGQLKAIES